MKKKLLLLLLVAMLGVFLFSGYVLANYMIQSHHQKQIHQQLVELTRVPEESTTRQEPLPTHVAVTNPDTGEERTVLREYAALYERNRDLVGWISIEGTRINYPVLQSAVKDYYLRRNFEKKRANHGSVYVWEAADVFAPSDNVTLFGHRMNDGTMFYDLLSYAREEFWQAHPTFRFDTLEGEYEYEIFAAFRTSGTGGEGFDYHTFVNAADGAQFDAFINKCKELSLYDTGITPQYGDKLATLSTCDYALKNGRMVVVGCRISNS